MVNQLKEIGLFEIHKIIIPVETSVKLPIIRSYELANVDNIQNRQATREPNGNPYISDVNIQCETPCCLCVYMLRTTIVKLYNYLSWKSKELMVSYHRVYDHH